MKYLRVLVMALALTPVAALAHPAEDLIRQITSDLISALKSPQAKSDESFVRGKLNSDVLPHIRFLDHDQNHTGRKAVEGINA